MKAAEFDVCDPLIGSTPGLYGMCVAYCKATELEQELADTAHPERLAFIAERKQRVLGRYNGMRQDSDPTMPCVQKVACPCWTSAQTSASFWLSRSGKPQCGGADMPPVTQRGIAGGSAAENDAVRMVAYINTEVGNNFCSYSDQLTGESSVQYVSETDVRVCATQIEATCSTLP